ncbi:hypothetical protein L9F63_016717, partial [Diploptera punctata]
SVARLKRLVQGITLVAAAAYTTLLLYQTVSTVAPRQQVKTVVNISILVIQIAMNGNLIVPAVSDFNNLVLATGTSRPVGTQLNDVFISVKTTRNYHKWRLPVILKTWFQLAKDQ